MASLTVNCPSCDAAFAVKDTLIGKKVDCPKCKYRFKVEEPGEDDADEKPSKKKAAKKSGGGSNMLIIGGIIGLLAVILLGVGGYFIFANGGDSKPSAPKPATTPPTAPTGGNNTNAGAAAIGMEGDATPGSGGAAGTSPGGQATAEAPKPSASSVTSMGDLKNPTLLLPGDTIRLIAVHADRLMTTPLYSTLFDTNTREFFKRSLTFDAADVEIYIHAVVNPDRTNFGIFRLKKPLDQQALLNGTDNEKGPQSPINGKHFYNTLKSNAFLDAIGRALAPENLADELGIQLTDEEKKKKADDKKLAYHVVDSHTLIIADQLDLERFLRDLDDKGLPPMKSVLAPDGPAPTPSETPGSPMPGGEGSPDGGKGSGPGMGFRLGNDNRTYLRTQLRPRGVPGSPGGQPPGDPQPGGGDQGQLPNTAAPRRSFTANPDYRSVDEELKYMMNRLYDEDTKNPPLIVYAEKIDQRIINQRALNMLFRATNDAVVGLMSTMKVVGVAIRQFDKNKFSASASFEFQNEADARTSTERFIQPILNQAIPILGLFLGTPIEIKNNSGGGGGSPGGLDIGGPGGPPGRGGGPGGPPSGIGGPPPGIAGGSPGVGPAGGEGPGGDPNGGGNSIPSSITVSLEDKATILALEILWNEDRYKRTIFPAIVSAATQMKGRMAVLSGETTWHSLASRFPSVLNDKKAFPRGTIERELKADRYGLAFPPEQRVSFLADLLPFLGKGGLRSTIKGDKLPWYAKENLTAAESWIPEFLVPYYPQTSWRAYHPLAEGKVLGATNFVGLSGLGLDSARFDPTNADHAKKIGITGYGWGSTKAEISDGLSNTIYLIQAPPGLRRPWIAGGGATIMGVDDQAANPVLDFVHQSQDKKRGTYVLMADGSVRWVTESIDPKVFKGMVTRAGGENLGNLDGLAPKVDPPKKTTIDIKGAAAANPTPASTTPATPADAIDSNELAKFQGDWKVTFLVANGVRVPKDQLDKIGLVVKIESDILRFESKTPLPMPLPSSKVVSMDTKSNPKSVTGETQDGPTKGQKGTTVYEFVGELKLKMRAAPPGSPTPKSVQIPDDKSKDTYIEMEKEPPAP
jgi:uncharacterized protein (TIGR03067 family)/predicted Zn finger-like uncharacterized protein